MYYNIYYEIVAVIIDIILITSKREAYKSKDKIERQFMYAVTVVFTASVMNVITAIGCAGILPIRDTWLLVIKTGYFVLSTYAGYQMLRLVSLRVGFLSEGFRIMNFAIASLFAFLLFVNIGGHFIFEYKNQVLIMNSHFSGIYLMDEVMYAEMLVVLIIFSRKVRKKVLYSTAILVGFPIMASIVQYFNENLLVSGLSFSIAYLMFVFSLGDQDFEELKKTQQMLIENKAFERRKRDEIEAAYRVKSRFLEGTSDELRGPIEKVGELSLQMKAVATDNKIGEYAEQMNEASKQLLKFVDNLMADVDKEKKNEIR